MFVKDDDLIDIKVYYKKIGYTYKVYTEKEFEKALMNDEMKKDYEVFNVKMRELQWGLYNQLQEAAMTENSNGEPKFNFKAYKENRLEKLIQEWDAVNKDGKPIQINSNSLAHLAPPIAEAVLRSYDEISLLDTGEEGNL